jgi:hypothetical protein
VIETVYQKINGSLEGLEEKINAAPVTASIERNPQPQQRETTVAQNIPKEIPAARFTPTPELKTTPEVLPTPTPEIKATPANQPTPTPELKATPEPSPEVKATSEPSPEIKATPTPLQIVEPSPISTPEQIAQVVIEKKPSPEPVAEKIPDVLPKPENSPAVLPSPEPSRETKWTVEIQNTGVSSNKSLKPLFEPIVITVPKSEIAKAEVKSEENETEEKPLDKKNESRTGRERVVTEKKSDSPAEEIVQCKIMVSQESISLINGGGNIGILVGFEEATGDLKKLTASSSSPNDIEVMLEPDIGAQSGRAFFIVKSISSNKGIYTITFDAPCGKKNVSVKVR